MKSIFTPSFDVVISRRKFINRFVQASFISILFPVNSRGAIVTSEPNFLSDMLEQAQDGENVEIPAGRYILKKPLILNGRNMIISGGGKVDLIVTGGNDTAISIENSKYIVIDGINITATNDCRAGVSLDACSNVKLTNMVIRNFREAGVEVRKSINCSIEKSKFYDSALDHRWPEPASSDVFINGTNSHISVSSCLHASAGGYAIQIRTNKVGEKSIGHVISGNNISGYNSYGIMLYRNGPYYAGDDQTVSNIMLHGNVIRSISGSRSANANKQDVKDFGAGIYLQGAESCLVEDNVIDGTNTATNTELLAPGAIGVANSGAETIRNNKISNCLYGIYINDSLGKGRPDGVIDILGNSFRSVRKLCIKIVAKDNVNISGSSYDVDPEKFMQKFGGHKNMIMNNIQQMNNKEF